MFDVLSSPRLDIGSTSIVDVVGELDDIHGRVPSNSSRSTSELLVCKFELARSGEPVMNKTDKTVSP